MSTSTSDFVIQTELGQLYGMSAIKIGKILKSQGLRELDGEPTQWAKIEGYVEKRYLEDRPFIHYWAWHFDKTAQALEEAGHKRVEL